MSDVPHLSPFEAIRRVSEEGHEYWSARELGKILGYATNYRNFKPAIEKAKEACQNSGQAVSDHFADVRNMINVCQLPKRAYKNCNGKSRNSLRHRDNLLSSTNRGNNHV